MFVMGDDMQCRKCFMFVIPDEINRLNERLRERGVDIETERKLEQVSIKP